jgi:hypothetical protein
MSSEDSTQASAFGGLGSFLVCCVFLCFLGIILGFNNDKDALTSFVIIFSARIKFSIRKIRKSKYHLTK